MRTVRLALFGAGWAAGARHVPAMRAHGGFELVAVADVHGERAAALARSAGGAGHHAAAGVEDLPDLDAFDAVACATPPATHAAVVEGALRAGKHVLCEKPLAVGADEVERLEALACENGVVLAVVHNFQFARSATRARHWIDSGRLGAIRSLRALLLSSPSRRLPPWYEELPLGLFYDESPHAIALARHLTSAELEPVSASVVGGDGVTPSQLDLSLNAAGVPVGLHMSFDSPVSEWHTMVLGERGVASVDLFRDIATFVPADGGHGPREVLRSSAAATAGHWAGYVRSGIGHLRGSLRYGADEVYARFHSAVVDGRRPEGIEASDAVAVARVQDWAVDAARAGEPA
ncbi:MAG: scyllo-inositol 2-dehydrogenase [Thermoleophilaceae bacterium]|nr:scyllo-inositol 2-dehydrogenase [Thermoleophilaceae bacterium]